MNTSPTILMHSMLALAAMSAASMYAQSPTGELSLFPGHSTRIVVGSKIDTVAVGAPEIADVRPLSPTEVMILGKAVGKTDVLVRLVDGATVDHRVHVRLDTADLQNKLRRLFGDGIEVEDLSGVAVVRGVLPDADAAAAMTRFLADAGIKWVNLTRMAGVQQVQLRVRIAEASRVAIRALGVSAVASSASGFGGIQSPGNPFQAVSIAPGPGGTITDPNFGYGAGNTVTTATTLFGGIPSSNLEVFLQALAENRYVRLLAEPNLVAVSGGEATFLVGGEFPVPIVQGVSGTSSPVVTVQYKEFGVRLNFRPQVLGEGRIRLEVAPEVSELSEIGALQQNGFTVPGIVTRRSSTTVELGTGQSFAMAGLLRSKEQARRSAVPLLGDLPVLGALFRSMRYEQEETELVVIVTAELVEPLDRVDTPLPGEFHVPPSDWQLFFSGRLSGDAPRQEPNPRMRALGLDELHGPGAWRRTDDVRVGAGEDRKAGPQSNSVEARQE